jgi:hypothetical protein
LEQVALTAYESLIFVNNPNPNWKAIEDLLAEIANRSAVIYNHTLSEDQYVSRIYQFGLFSNSTIYRVLGQVQTL